MKRCPQCHRVETDESLKFCRVDGATLVSDSASIDREAGTVKLGSSSSRESETSIPPAVTDSQVSRATAATTVLPSQLSTSAASKLTKQKHRTAIVIVVIATAAIAALTAIVVNSYRSIKRSTSIQSIAVLPFENGSGNADLEYLSDGISESVIDHLSQLSQLKVIARSSSFTYRGQNLDLKKVADTLEVDAMITGRVVQRGDNYEIRVEIIDARENRNLWSETFKASDTQVLQADISREIAENLRPKLGTETQKIAKQTTNPQSYQLVLKGNFYRNKGTAEDLKKSIECFQQAISIDTNNALAFSGLADAYRFLGGDPKESLPKREAAIRQALELDENLSDAHFSMGQYQRDLWHWPEAEREYRRAMQLNPNSAHAHSGLSGLLSLLGRHDEAIAEDKRAAELDPVGVVINTVAGRTLHYARRYDEAVERLTKTIELDQSNPTPHLRLADVYFTKGMYREAINEYQQTLRLGNTSSETQIRLAATYAKIGERERAFDNLKQLQASDSYISPALLAIFYAASDDAGQTFASLEKAYMERDPRLQILKVDPAFDGLHSDPRFKDLLKRMNLPQ